MNKSKVFFIFVLALLAVLVLVLLIAELAEAEGLMGFMPLVLKGSAWPQPPIPTPAPTMCWPPCP